MNSVDCGYPADRPDDSYAVIELLSAATISIILHFSSYSRILDCIVCTVIVESIGSGQSLLAPSVLLHIPSAYLKSHSSDITK